MCTFIAFCNLSLTCQSKNTKSNQMARVLKQEIKQQIIDDNQLAADFCDQMGIKIISLDQMLRRDNRSLTHADNITWLSERLNQPIDEILTESEAKATA